MSGRDGERLRKFMRDGGDQFAHRADSARVGKFGLELFGTSAIFNVGKGSVPFNNLSMGVPKRDTPHKKPPIFPIGRTAEPRLVFERLSGCNGTAPLFG